MKMLKKDLIGTFFYILAWLQLELLRNLSRQKKWPHVVFQLIPISSTNKILSQIEFDQIGGSIESRNHKV